MLHRITYLRDGQPRSVTFAGDLAEAAEFEALWERVTKCPVLTRKVVATERLGLPVAPVLNALTGKYGKSPEEIAVFLRAKLADLRREES